MKEDTVVVVNGLNNLHNETFIQISNHIANLKCTLLYYIEEEGYEKDINLLKRLGTKKNVEKLNLENNQLLFKNNCIFLTTPKNLKKDVVDLFASDKICMFGDLYESDIDEQINFANDLNISNVFSDHTLNEISVNLSKKNKINFKITFIPYNTDNTSRTGKHDEEILYIRQEPWEKRKGFLEIVLDQCVKQKKAKSIVLAEKNIEDWVSECTPSKNCKLVIIDGLTPVLHNHTAQLCAENNTRLEVISKQIQCGLERIMFYGKEYFPEEIFELSRSNKSLREKIKRIFFDSKVTKYENNYLGIGDIFSYIENILFKNKDKNNNFILIDLYNQFLDDILDSNPIIEPLPTINATNNYIFELISFITRKIENKRISHFSDLIIPIINYDYILNNYLSLDRDEFIYENLSIISKSPTNFTLSNFSKVSKLIHFNDKHKNKLVNFKIDQIVSEIYILFLHYNSTDILSNRDFFSNLPISYLFSKLLNKTFSDQDFNSFIDLPENSKWSLLYNYLIYIPPNDELDKKIFDYLNSLNFRNFYDLKLFYLLVLFTSTYKSNDPINLIYEIDNFLDAKNKRRRAKIIESYPFLIQCIFLKLLRDNKVDSSYFELIKPEKLNGVTQFIYLAICISSNKQVLTDQLLKVLNHDIIDEYFEKPSIYSLPSKILFTEIISLYFEIDELAEMCREIKSKFSTDSHYKSLIERIDIGPCRESLVKDSVIQYFQKTAFEFLSNLKNKI